MLNLSNMYQDWHSLCKAVSIMEKIIRPLPEGGGFLVLYWFSFSFFSTFCGNTFCGNSFHHITRFMPLREFLTGLAGLVYLKKGFHYFAFWTAFAYCLLSRKLHSPEM